MKITAPASRDLQENDIDVYVRLDLLATTVRKVTLKMIEMKFACMHAMELSRTFYYVT